MAEPYKFELVSPERLLVSETVESVVIPGTEGEMTVMANHAPVMALVKPGIVTVRTTGGQERRFAVFGGFADILPDVCTLLAESGLPAESLTKADILTRIETARTDLSAVADDDDQGRTKLEEFLHHLAALEDAVP